MLKIYYFTHIGLDKTSHEDAVMIEKNVFCNSMSKPRYTTQKKNYGIYAVADGISGSPYGEVASKMVLELLYKHFDPSKRVTATIIEVQDKLASYIISHPKYHGMGTTLAGVFIDDTQMQIFHVGDSRVYRYRGESLECLTQDHTIAQKMAERGEIASADGAADIYKMLDSAIIASNEADDFEIGLSSRTLQKGDHILVCTDGVSDILSEGELQWLFCTQKDTPKLAKSIQKNILKGGAYDNFSFILIALY